TRSAQRLAIFVKSCIAVAPIARARRGASCEPPATDTWAPRRTSSAQTGATQAGSFALSSFALNAGRLPSCFFAAGSSFADFAVVFFFAGAFFFGALFFFAGFFFLLAIKLRRFSMK